MPIPRVWVQYLGGALGQRAGQNMKVTSRSSGCHGTCRPPRVEGSLPGPFELELKPECRFFSRRARMSVADGRGATCLWSLRKDLVVARS